MKTIKFVGTTDVTYVTGEFTGPVTLGDQRDVSDEAAEQLVAGGQWEYAEEVKSKKAVAKADKEVQSQQSQ